MAASTSSVSKIDEDAVDFRYTVGEVIGTGASGVVKLGTDRVNSKNVCVVVE